MIERVGERFPFPEAAFERMVDRRDRKRRNQRLAAAAVGIAVFVAAVAFVLNGNPFDRGERPAVPIPTEGDLRHNGEVLVSHEGDLLAEDPVTGETRVVMSLADLGLRGDDGVRTELAAWSADGNWVAAELISCLGGLFCGHPDAGLWIQGATEPKRQITRTCTHDGCTGFDRWEWAPVGSKLALAEMDRRGGWVGVGPSTLSIIDPVDGSRVDVVTEPDTITALGWSPDGQRLAYAVAGETPRVLVIDLEAGTEPRVLTGEVGKVGALAWSPDGSILAIDGASRLFVIGADGSGLRLLDPGTESVIGHAPTWSPDGSRIAFRTAPPTTRASETGELEVEVWTTTPDGSDTVRVYDFGCCAESWHVAGPFWSPDGDRIAFTSDTVSYQGGEFRAGTWFAAAADGSGDVEVLAPALAKAWGGGRWPTGCTLVTEIC